MYIFKCLPISYVICIISYVKDTKAETNYDQLTLGYAMIHMLDVKLYM